MPCVNVIKLGLGSRFNLDIRCILMQGVIVMATTKQISNHVSEQGYNHSRYVRLVKSRASISLTSYPMKHILLQQLVF